VEPEEWKWSEPEREAGRRAAGEQEAPFVGLVKWKKETFWQLTDGC